MRPDIHEICNKINLLAGLDTGREIFGASKHEYTFNPRKTEHEILAFERTNNIFLPDDYKRFLLSVGNGGMGPSYGLLRLENYNGERPHEFGLPDSFLNAPFKFTPDNPYDETEDDAYENSAEYSLETTGTISICHHGCGIYSLLVISGGDRGSVWVDDRRNDGGLARESASFFEWYDTWLQNSISQLEEKINSTLLWPHILTGAPLKTSSVKAGHGDFPFLAAK